MHMANELLSIPVAAGTLAIATGSLGFICRKVRQVIAAEKLALMGILGAFVFAEDQNSDHDVRPFLFRLSACVRVRRDIRDKRDTRDFTFFSPRLRVSPLPARRGGGFQGRALRGCCFRREAGDAIVAAMAVLQFSELALVPVLDAAEVADNARHPADVG